MSKRVLTVTQWLAATSGFQLKDEVRDIARLGDGGWLSIQASRYHHSAPQVDNAKRYTSIEIGSRGVEEGPPDAASRLAMYALKHGHSTVFARVPIDVADSYVLSRGGIVVPA